MVTTFRLFSVPNRNIRNYWCQFCIYLQNTERQVILNVCFCILLLYTEITLSKRRVSVDTMIHLIFNWFETKSQLLDLPLYSSQQNPMSIKIPLFYSQLGSLYTVSPKKLLLLAWGHLRKCNFFWDTVYFMITTSLTRLAVDRDKQRIFEFGLWLIDFRLLLLIGWITPLKPNISLDWAVRVALGYQLDHPLYFALNLITFLWYILLDNQHTISTNKEDLSHPLGS